MRVLGPISCLPVNWCNIAIAQVCAFLSPIWRTNGANLRERLFTTVTTNVPGPEVQCHWRTGKRRLNVQALQLREVHAPQHGLKTRF